MMESIQEERKRRLQFMKKLFEKTNGDEMKYCMMFEIGEELGFDRDTTQRVAHYLHGENLLEYKSLGGGIGITHWGVKEMEESLTNPAKPTTHFPAVNIINIGHMENSQIQQGGTENIQLHINNPEIKELRDLIFSIKNSNQDMGLDAINKQDLDSEISTIEAQISSSKPKKNIIIECLKSIKTIIEGVASNTIAQGILTQLGSILLHLTTGT